MIKEANVKVNEDVYHKLSLKQRLFVDYYVKTKNATQSAIKAGYSRKSADTIAMQNLKKDRIKECIEVKFNALRLSEGLTDEQIKQFWKEMMDKETANDSDRLRASELAAKANGMFKDNQTNVAIFNGVTKEDLGTIYSVDS